METVRLLMVRHYVSPTNQVDCLDIKSSICLYDLYESTLTYVQLILCILNLLNIYTPKTLGQNMLNI